MIVEVINTGTELLLGNVVNSHLAFFGKQLFPLGLRITRQVTVPDGEAIRDALLESFGRAEIVLVTGGLGPTT
ncbi:MAG: molybdopterin-binding protein, partial [Verrucomicrobiota bacterium]